LWFTSSWKPDRIFSVDSFKELFSFGGWLLFAGMIRKIFDNIYILTIGKFFPLAQVGFYTQAKKIRQLSSEQVAGAIGIVAFPLFSKLQADKTKLKMAMRNFLQHTLFFLVPAMVLLIVIAKPFVILVLTGKWAPMIPYMQLLCFAGILYPIHLVNVQVLVAQGKSRLSFGLDVLKNTLRIINIIISFRFGVIFIILGEVILSIIALLINTYYTNKFVGYSFLNQLKDVYKILTISFFVGLTVYFAFSTIENYWLLLFGQTILFGCIYIGLSYFIDRKFFKEILELKKYFVKNV